MTRGKRMRERSKCFIEIYKLWLILMFILTRRTRNFTKTLRSIFRDFPKPHRQFLAQLKARQPPLPLIPPRLHLSCQSPVIHISYASEELTQLLLLLLRRFQFVFVRPLHWHKKELHGVVKAKETEAFGALPLTDTHAVLVVTLLIMVQKITVQQIATVTHCTASLF